MRHKSFHCEREGGAANFLFFDPGTVPSHALPPSACAEMVFGSANGYSPNRTHLVSPISLYCEYIYLHKKIHCNLEGCGAPMPQD